MATHINKTVLMSGTDYFSVAALNPYSDETNQPIVAKAAQELTSIQTALRQSGIKIIAIPAPAGCPDGVFTANWAVCRQKTAVIASLPPGRQQEEAYAERCLKDLGKHTIRAPYHFSGQGDALACGDLLFVGSGYRTDRRMHHFLAEALGCQVISLQTVPMIGADGRPAHNAISGWPDSFFYDLDLALAVLTPTLIAWCPSAFTPESQEKIRSLPLDTIEVSLEEATRYFACNLVSTGTTVIMGEGAEALRSAITARGFTIITLAIRELAKGGGFIRCTTLTLD